MATITCVDVAHSYVAQPQTDADWALKPLRYTWQDGGAYALLGPSGCGKTTLLNIISGLLSPRAGALRFDGAAVTHLPAERRNVAQVFQFPVVYDTMTARENLAFPLRNRGASPAQARARVDEVAALLDIGDWLDMRATQLSADAKQIIALGRGLARKDVGVILFDEPLTVIDPHIKWRLRAALKRLHAQTGVTMIYVTHDQTEALTFADEIAVMHDGRLAQSGAAAELFERPRHTFVGHFIGSPGMNLLPCKVDGDAVFVDRYRVAVAPFSARGIGGGMTQLGARPEFVEFAADASGDKRDGIPAMIDRVQDLGSKRIVSLTIAGAREIKMVCDDSIALPSTPATMIRFNPARAYVYVDGVLQTAENEEAA